jgi:FkbM family methyltransferase
VYASARWFVPGIEETAVDQVRGSSQDEPGPRAFTRLKRCRHGLTPFLPHDVFIGRSLDLYGEFSEGEVKLFGQLVKAGDVVLDVGANIGAHTLFFAEQVGAAGAVHAFEPQRILFQTLCGNLALNGITNTWAHASAVGAEPGQVVVPPIDYSQPNNFGCLALGAYQAGEQVNVVTLDGLGLTRCDFLKVDVEGMEHAVLRGAAGTIARFRPFLYIENDRADCSTELVSFIDRLGYVMYWHHPPLYSADNYFGNPDNVFKNMYSVNMLCIHSSIRAELVGFTPVAVPGAALG